MLFHRGDILVLEWKMSSRTKYFPSCWADPLYNWLTHKNKCYLLSNIKYIPPSKKEKNYLLFIKARHWRQRIEVHLVHPLSTLMEELYHAGKEWYSLKSTECYFTIDFCGYFLRLCLDVEVSPDSIAVSSLLWPCKLLAVWYAGQALKENTCKIIPPTVAFSEFSVTDSFALHEQLRRLQNSVCKSKVILESGLKKMNISWNISGGYQKDTLQPHFNNLSDWTIFRISTWTLGSIGFWTFWALPDPYSSSNKS